MKLILLFLVTMALLFPDQLFAHARKPATVSEISTYMGADREQLPYAGAKSEGVVNWYMSRAGDSHKALSLASEAKYPGVRVEAFRAGGSDLTVRMTEDIKARRPTKDALETTYDFMMVSKAYGLTRPYNSPALAAYPSESKEKADAGLTFWTIFRESYMGFGFSKDQVPASVVPKGFDGLSHPQLKGKMGITLNESSARSRRMRTAPLCSSIFSSAPSRARCWRNFNTVIRRIICRSSAGTLVSAAQSNSLRKTARSGKN